MNDRRTRLMLLLVRHNELANQLDGNDGPSTHRHNATITQQLRHVAREIARLNQDDADA